MQQVDNMSIDLEERDFKVLESNNGEKYRPEMVLLEASVVCEIDGNTTIRLFKTERSFKLLAKTYRTSSYKIVWN